MELSISQPFDLASSVLSGQAHRWRPDQSGDGWHWGVIQGNLIKIRQLAGHITGHFPDSVEVYSSPTLEPEQMKRLLSSYFRLNDDVEAIYCDISGDSRVATMVDRYRGLRLLRIDPWECLISFICSANSNLARIQANMEAMSESFGQPLALDGHVRHTFPTPEQLAKAGEAALRALGLGFRSPYVAQAAVAVASGELHLEPLRKLPYPEAKERLMELPGVGPKIADCVLLHSLDKLEAFPIDVWVRRALSEWYFSSGDSGQAQKPPPDKAMLEWALEHFGPYAGYAELYLFHGRRMGKG
jgi:N-glycosylase/DNA lyase